MGIDTHDVLGAVAIGIGATLLMDLWNLFLTRAFGIPSLNYCLLGRWLRHMPSGTFRHTSIAAASPCSFECSAGWMAHYTIGVVFALILAVLTAGDSIAQPALWPALAFGIGTIVFPFFVLQPSIGLGIAASKTSDPSRARLKSLATHTVFGAGLYLAARAVGYVWPGLP
jgi:hypothetical protein